MTYRSTLHKEPGYLLDYLGRMLRGWANYIRHGVSKATFSAIDSYAWERITAWLRKKHRIGWPELRRRFCLPGTWRLAVNGTGSRAQPASQSSVTATAATGSRPRGHPQPPPAERQSSRGEPGAVRIARRVRRAVRGNGTAAMRPFAIRHGWSV
ncbi:hypothetical protein J7I92_23260 [Arthrobacter sp. ISL-72]|nr:hypothetical protein [Arthrobacter sp. ISL-72]